MKEQVTVMGLDISTSKIGLSIITTDKRILTSEVIKFKTETPLEEKVDMLVNKIEKLKKYYYVSEVFIEEPFIAFSSGKTTAQTMAKLQRFNGMCCYAVYKLFNSCPTMVSVRSARSKLGIKIPKGTKQGDAKKHIIEYVERNHPEFVYSITAHGNPVPGTDDRADAIVLALYGLESETL
jgi:hypothetical protein